ncbi:DUF3137 domain-containing protein [Micavibrio aeruginosavorus]|uniref:DUF3137 domain-containing protein n=1 Tax=Micavibrio aeruginosavorus TaxID=349221 RepID=UPI003F4AB602
MQAQTPDITTLCATLDEQRQRYMQVFVMGSPMAFAALCAIGALMMSEETGFPWVFVLFWTAIVTLVLFHVMNMKYRKRTKAALMRDLATGMGLEFKADGVMDWDDVAPHAILPPHDRCGIEDGFTGTIANVPVAFQEMNLVDISRDRDGDTTETTVFHGAVIRIGIGKTLNAHTVIMPDGAAGRFWRTAFSKFEPVRLSAPDFENRFDVMATDQLEAHYILDPGFMESFLAVGDHIGTKNFEASFRGSEILFAISRPGALFEIGHLFHALTPQDLATVQNEIAAIEGLVNALKLNPYTGLGAKIPD